jgi:hypothetical protein
VHAAVTTLTAGIFLAADGPRAWPATGGIWQRPPPGDYRRVRCRQGGREEYNVNVPY